MRMYQIADLTNGAFGDTFTDLEQAEVALAEVIKEGNALNELHTPEGYEVPRAEEFFFIVELEV